MPPSNQLCHNALNAIQIFKLNISGLYGKDMLKLRDNLFRVYYQFIYGLHFPYTYRNVTNQLTYHSLTSIANFDDLICKLEMSSKLNAPFQIATHYWELDSELLYNLKEICRHAKNLGYRSLKLSDYFNS